MQEKPLHICAISLFVFNKKIKKGFFSLAIPLPPLPLSFYRKLVYTISFKNELSVSIDITRYRTWKGWFFWNRLTIASYLFPLGIDIYPKGLELKLEKKE